jgi:hypothetical protein
LDSFVITWRELLIIVAVVLAVYVAEMLLLLRTNRGFRRWKPDAGADQPRMAALEAEIEQLREQILTIHQQLEDRPIPQPQHTHSTSPPSSPYSQAIQMAQQGMSVDELAAGCGISRGEAELIVAMHQARTP